MRRTGTELRRARSTRRLPVLVGALVPLLALAPLGAPPAAAKAPAQPGASADASLPASAGPALLRWPPATAPQLENSGIWHAPPLLVSGATAYRDGEFLYQGFLYGDAGADGVVRDPSDPRADTEVLSQTVGTYTYPTGPGYDANAANLVEFRVKPRAGATAFRVTLNTMVDPDLVAFTIALGDSASPTHPYPFGAGVHGPAGLFLTVHGTTAVLQRAGGGAVVLPAPTVSLSLARHQFTVLVPHRDFDPGRSVVTMACGVGLWDQAHGDYLHPRSSATATVPGGAGVLAHPEAFFDVAFRTHEPADAANPWRDEEQAHALARGTMAPFTIPVSFAALARGVTDDRGIPTTGFIDRILASHFSPEPGVDFSHPCAGVGEGCLDEFEGNLQPYALFVPPRRHGAPYGLTLELHGSESNYNAFTAKGYMRQLALRGTGSIVLTPEARGPDGVYDSLALADVFEAWADVAHHYPLDPAWTDVTGYSMGGFGAFKLAVQFPDLFARVQPDVGTGGAVLDPLFSSLRDVPVLMWNAQDDASVTPALYDYDARTLAADGLRFTMDVFDGAGHLTLLENDQFAPAARFLGTATVDADPARVTYVVDPEFFFPRYGIVADHVYWLSGLTLRTTGSKLVTGRRQSPQPLGTVDAVSWGIAGANRSDPAPTGERPTAGTVRGGDLGPLAYAGVTQGWVAPSQRPSPPEDRITLRTTGLSAVTIDTHRAGVDCAVRLAVSSDGPLTVHLTGCGRVLRING